MLLSEITQFIKKTHLEVKSEPFRLSDEFLNLYLCWAFSNDYLFIDSDENGLTGVLSIYLLPKPYNGSIESLAPSNQEIKKSEEKDKDICFMDGIFKTPNSRKNIINKFMKRFPNWKNQKKYAIRKGSVKELQNRYILLTGGIL